MSEHKDLHGNLPFTGCLESQIGGRAENQDCADFCDTFYGRLVVVCDGMGGGPGGATASTESVRVILETVKNAPKGKDKQDLLTEAVKSANRWLRHLQLQHRHLQGMGSTCVCLLIDDYSAVVAQVGDSRVYQFRFGRKHWRTWDHSQVMDRVKALYGRTTGKDVEEAVEEARTSPNSNVITRALGVCDDVSVETHELAYEVGDRFALCTDGVWGSMPEKELISLLNAKVVGGALAGTMCRVQEVGVDNGNHHDNFTLALLQTNVNSKLKDKMTHKARFIIYCLSVVCLVSLCACLIFALNGINRPSTSLPSTNVAILDTIQCLRQEKNDLLKDNQELVDSLKIAQTVIAQNKWKFDEKKDAPKQETQPGQELESSLEPHLGILELCISVEESLTDILTWSKNHPDYNKNLPADLDSKRTDAFNKLKEIESKADSFPEKKDQIEMECKYLRDKLTGQLKGVPRSRYYQELLDKHVNKLKDLLK